VALTLDQRREILASMPWVAVSPAPKLFGKRCEGIRTSIPLSARLHTDEESQRQIWGCRKRARWVFLGLDGEIHTYCWHHLFIYGLGGSQEEQDRYQGWLDQYMQNHPDPPDWNDQEPDMPLSRH
jgi:hypothetical protein